MNDPVWINGRLVSAAAVTIDPADRGLLLGDGLFETMRVADGHVPHLRQHVARLHDGCALLNLAPPSLVVIHKAIEELLSAEERVSGSVRLTLTRGVGSRGLLPPTPCTPVLMLRAFPPALAVKPVRVGISRYRRDGRNPLSQVKSLSYLDAVLAKMEAVRSGYDDAVFLGVEGCVTEASAANIVFMRRGQWFTPPLSDGPLPGTTRARLIESGQCAERSLSVQELRTAEAAWLISALSITPITAFDGQDVPLSPDDTERLLTFL